MQPREGLVFPLEGAQPAPDRASTTLASGTPHCPQPLPDERSEMAVLQCQPASMMTYRPSRGVRVPISRSGLALDDPHMEAEFVDADVISIVVERLPWVCALMAVFDALHLAARASAWRRAGGAETEARLACACLLPGILVWALLALGAHAMRLASTRPGVQPPLRALSAALAAALVLDALPLDILAQPSLLGAGAAPALTALALQQLLAPVAISCFCPLTPIALLCSGVTAVCAFALAGARAELDVGVVAQCALAQVALISFLVAHRWDAGAIERRYFYRARQAWLSQVRTLASKQNAEQLHASVLGARQQEALAAAADAAATARAELIRILSHDIRGPLLIAANVAGEMEDVCDEMRAAPPSQPAPVDCETFARLSGQLHAATLTMSRIVSQLADFGRAESNTIVLQRRAFTLGALVDAVGRAAAERAERKAVQVWVPPLSDKAAGCRVTADFARLAQAIDAGVSNAINASTKGGKLTLAIQLAPEIDQQLLALEAEPNKAGWVLVVVRVVDHGAGLDAAQLDAVRHNKVFAHVRESQLNGASATGVGLAHTRRILELHDDSSFALHSDGRARGCTLELRLRLRRAHADDEGWAPPEPAAAPAPTAASSLRGGRPAPQRAAVTQSPLPPVERLARSSLVTDTGALSASVLAALDEGAHADAALELLASPNSLGMRVRVALHGAHMAAAARRRRSSTVSCLSLEADASALGAGGAGGPAEHATADDARQVGGAAPPTSQWRSAISRRQSVKLAANASSVAVPPAGADRSGEASRRQSARTASSSGDHGRWRPRPSRGSQPTSEPGDYNLSKLARASAHSLIAGLMGSAAASPSRAGGSALAPGAPTQSPGWLRGVGALSSAARVAPASGAGGGARAAGGGKAPKPTFPQGFRALYAEDDAVLRKSVVLRVFKPLGITVDEAHDGAEVLRLCDVRERELGAGAADAYAFVLLDNQMPHLTGTQVAKELRARGYSAHIVGMTGDPRGCTDRAVFEVSGVDHCFDKDSASVSKVRELLAAYAISDAISGEPVAAASPSSFPPPGFSPGVKGQGDVAGPSMEATETAPSSAVVGPTKMDTIPDDPGAEAPSFRHALGHDS